MYLNYIPYSKNATIPGAEYIFSKFLNFLSQAIA
jgi:hypothetical protein